MMSGMLRRLRGDRRGVTALEYGLIAALVAVVIITGVKALGVNAGSVFEKVAGEMATTK